MYHFCHDICLKFCRIQPPEYFKNKFGADEAYYVDEVKQPISIVHEVVFV